MNVLEDVLGTSLMEKVKAANKRQRRFEFTDLNKKELLVSFKENIEKAIDTHNEMKYSWTVGSNKYDVAIMKSYGKDGEEIPYKTGMGKGNSTWSMTKMKYGLEFGRKCSVFLSEDQFKTIVQDQEYIVIGYMKVGEFNGRPTYSFNLHELLPLAEFNNELAKLREKGL